MEESTGSPTHETASPGVAENVSPEPPSSEIPPPPRFTKAGAFRCRRRAFRRPITVILTLLTVLLLAVLFHTRHKGYEAQYEASCVQTMDSLLLTLIFWDSAPPASRWLSGYVSREQFLSSFEMYANAARRDGYLTDAVRLRMVQACLMFDRRAEAREWHDEMTDAAWQESSRAALTSANMTETLREFARAVANDTVSEAGDAGFAMEEIWNQARVLYRNAWITNAVLLAAMGAGVPFLWPVIRLLLRRGHAPQRRAARLEKTWTPGRVWRALVRAEWTFLYSGLTLTVLSGLAWLVWEAGDTGLAAEAAAWYWTKLGEVSQSVWSNLFYVALLCGPVFLMVRWLTPGFHSTLRLFGIRRCPLSGESLRRTALAGLTLVGLLYLSFDFITASLGISDPRDGWMHGDEPVWEGILYGCLVAPFAEEFLFRGFLFTGLRGRWGALPAAVFSSLLFSIGHGYSFAGTILIASFGMLMCALYHRTGTLLVPMIVHALTNALLML